MIYTCEKTFVEIQLLLIEAQIYTYSGLLIFPLPFIHVQVVQWAICRAIKLAFNPYNTHTRTPAFFYFCVRMCVCVVIKSKTGLLACHLQDSPLQTASPARGRHNNKTKGKKKKIINKRKIIENKTAKEKHRVLSSCFRLPIQIPKAITEYKHVHTYICICISIVKL